MFGKSNFKVRAVYCDGISTFTTNALMNVIINKDENQLTFENKFDKVPNANLSVDKITNAAWITEKEVKDASVIGNAMVGGILFGGLGAMVGAVKGTKKKSETYFVINYTASDGTLKAISMKPHGDLKLFKLEKELKQLIKVAPIEELEL